MESPFVKNILLSGSFLVVSITQSYLYSDLTKSSTYGVHPIVLFCYISLCISGYAFVAMVEENRGLYKTMLTIVQAPMNIVSVIMLTDSFGDFLNTTPRMNKMINYSMHATIEKSDMVVSFLFAYFVKKNATIYDFISTLFTMVGILMYFSGVINLSSIHILSIGTASIILSKFCLEVSIYTEGMAIRSKKLSENHVLFLSNIAAPFTFMVGLYFLPDITTEVMNSFYSISLPITFTLYLIGIMVIDNWWVNWPLRLGFVMITPDILNVFGLDFKRYILTISIGILWIVMMKIKMACHTNNFSGLQFALLNAVIFAFKVSINAHSIFDFHLLAAISFITLGTLISIKKH